MVCQLKAVFTSQDLARNFYRKCGDNVETLADGKWQRYAVVPVSTQASGPVSSEANVLTAAPLRLEVVETPAGNNEVTTK